MELFASVSYGIMLAHDTTEELINPLAVFEAAQETPGLKDKIDDYFEVYDDEDNPIDVDYPSEVLGLIAEYHPDFAGRLDYAQFGNIASIDGRDSAIVVLIASTYQETGFIGGMSALEEPSEEDIQVLHSFMSRFLKDVSEAPVPAWLLGASSS